MQSNSINIILGSFLRLLVLVCSHLNTTISVDWHLSVQFGRGTLIQVILVLSSTVNVFTIVYKSKGYVAAIESCAEASMMKAIDEIKATSNYETDGEVQLINNSVIIINL